MAPDIQKIPDKQTGEIIALIEADLRDQLAPHVKNEAILERLFARLHDQLVQMLPPRNMVRMSPADHDAFVIKIRTRAERANSTPELRLLAAVADSDESFFRVEDIDAMIAALPPESEVKRPERPIIDDGKLLPDRGEWAPTPPKPERSYAALEASAAKAGRPIPADWPMLRELLERPEFKGKEFDNIWLAWCRVAATIEPDKDGIVTIRRGGGEPLQFMQGHKDTFTGWAIAPQSVPVLLRQLNHEVDPGAPALPKRAKKDAKPPGEWATRKTFFERLGVKTDNAGFNELWNELLGDVGLEKVAAEKAGRDPSGYYLATFRGETVATYYNSAYNCWYVEPKMLDTFRTILKPQPVKEPPQDKPKAPRAKRIPKEPGPEIPGNMVTTHYLIEQGLSQPKATPLCKELIEAAKKVPADPKTGVRHVVFRNVHHVDVAQGGKKNAWRFGPEIWDVLHDIDPTIERQPRNGRG